MGILDAVNNAKNRAGMSNAAPEVASWSGTYNNKTDTSYPTGGAAGSSGPTDNDRKAFANLGALTGFQLQTPEIHADQGWKILDNSLAGSEAIYNTQMRENKAKAANDWFLGQLKLQQTVDQLTDAMGNAAYGSSLENFQDAYRRQDDIQDVGILNQTRENDWSIDTDFDEIKQSNIDSKNELASDTEQAKRNTVADYAAQANNIHPDLAAGLFDTTNNTINIPANMTTTYFDDHFVSHVDPRYQGLYRLDADSATAAKQGLVRKDNTAQFASSGNMDYWTRRKNGYQGRTQ